MFVSLNFYLQIILFIICCCCLQLHFTWFHLAFLCRIVCDNLELFSQSLVDGYDGIYVRIFISNCVNRYFHYSFDHLIRDATLTTMTTVSVCIRWCRRWPNSMWLRTFVQLIDRHWLNGPDILCVWSSCVTISMVSNYCCHLVRPMRQAMWPLVVQLMPNWDAVFASTYLCVCVCECVKSIIEIKIGKKKDF